MEYKEIARDAIDSAKRWLVSADLNAGAGNFDSALYSLEMSVEISMKAVLLSINIDVPKEHRIGDIFDASINTDKRIPKEFRQHAADTVNIFNALLELRTASGYMFETKTTIKDLKVKYEYYKKDAKRIVEICAKTVHAIV